MGYTHYWKIEGISDFPAGAVEDIKIIVEHYAEVIREDCDTDLPPLVRENLIHFNGIEEDGYETFVLEPTGSGWCKTEKRPYDIVVCEALLVMKHHLGSQMDLKSDGFWVSKEMFKKSLIDENWNTAFKNVKETFGYTYLLTPAIRPEGYYCFILN